MAEREIERWVTWKGRRIPIYKDTPGKEVYDYSSLNDPADMCMELYKRTGINMRGRLRGMHPETCAQVCTTLEDLQNKYHINEADDPNSSEGDRLDVVVPDTYSPEYEYFKQSEGENDEIPFAVADLCRISLNPDYYKMSPEDLDAVYAEGVGPEYANSDNFHPKGTTAKDIVAHEVAHHMLDKKIWDMVERDYGRYQTIQRFLTENVEYTGVSEDTLPDIQMMFKKFDRIRKKYIKQISQDEEAVSYLGGKPRENTMLREMANPISFGRYGICKYSARNYHELIAEAFADFYANGKKARPLSRLLVKEIFGIK